MKEKVWLKSDSIALWTPEVGVFKVKKRRRAKVRPSGITVKRYVRKMRVGT